MCASWPIHSVTNHLPMHPSIKFLCHPYWAMWSVWLNSLPSTYQRFAYGCVFQRCLCFAVTLKIFMLLFIDLLNLNWYYWEKICWIRFFIVILSSVFNVSFFFCLVFLFIPISVLCIFWLKITTPTSIKGRKFPKIGEKRIQGSRIHFSP